MNPAIPLLAMFLVGPIVSVVIVQVVTEGRVGGRITHGWVGLAAYFVAGQLLRLIVGTTLWSVVVGLVAALLVGLILRGQRRKQSSTSRAPTRT